MSVYVEAIGDTGADLVAGRLTADCRGELFVLADRIGLGVPRLCRKGTPDEYVPLTAASLRDAIACGAFELVRVDGEEHVRTREVRASRNAPHDMAS